MEFSSFLERLEPVFLYHYNGDTFDLPYLRSKYDFYRLPVPEPIRDPAFSRDLFRMIRPLKKRLPLASLRQQDLESFLNTSRTDDTCGKDLIETYYSFLQTGSGKDLDLLFLHNHDDVLGLASILPVLVYRDFWEKGCARFSWRETDASLEIRFCPEQPFPVTFQLLPGTDSDPFGPEEGSVCLTFETNEAILSVPKSTGERKLYYPDWRSYYYLPAEDEAIHKSVGQFVDPAHRQQAGPDTCYRRVRGRFLPLPRRAALPEIPVFYRTRSDPEAWIRAEDLTGSGNANIAMYASLCLKEWF